MGYLIQNGDIITNEIIIPQNDAQIMDTAPFTIYTNTNNTAIQLISLSLTLLNNTNSYIGFNHLYAIDDITLNILGVYDEITNIEGIKNGYYTYLILNMAHPPNRFGAWTKQNAGIQLQFAAPITGGDGDIGVSFQYRLIK